jgi:hypothetical protein
MGLMYYGVTYPQASYLLLGILLVFKALPSAYRLLLGTCRYTVNLWFDMRYTTKVDLGNGDE